LTFDCYLNINIADMLEKKIVISDRTLIMNSQRITDCTLRIAYQIFELNILEKLITIVGIEKNGLLYAKKIAENLSKISNIKISLIGVKINKKNPLSGFSCSEPLEKITNTPVLLVDDVLNSGKTLIYAVKYLIEFQIKSLKIAVLVNRNHKNFPVKADFKGISLSTSINEHITVELEKNKEAVYLS